VDGSDTDHGSVRVSELAHYGVKGMKWGVRKTDISGAPPKGSEDARAVVKYQKKASKGGTKTLSNKELQEIVQRLNLEQQYSRLNTQPTKLDKIRKGNENVRTILGVVKTVQEIHSFLNSPLGKTIRNSFNQARS